MEAFELSIHKMNTKAFIDSNPVAIILKSLDGEERVSGGGKKAVPGEDREPQVFRIIETGQPSEKTQKTQDGTVRDVAFLLLAEVDAVIEVGDHWIAADSRHWQVVDIDNTGQATLYEKRAAVSEYGK